MALIQYAWAGEPRESPSIKYVDGVEAARNVIHDGRVIGVLPNQGLFKIVGKDGAARADIRLYGQDDLIHHEDTVYVLSFWARKVSGEITHMGGHTVPTYMNTEAYMDGEYVRGGWAQGISGLGIHDNEPHFFEVKLTASENDAGTPMGNGGVYIQPNRLNYGPEYELEVWDIALQSRPANAPELDPTYFNGDTPDYYDNATPKVYLENGWATLAPRFYI